MGEPRYTEKEMVMAQREAFYNGSHAAESFHPESIRAASVRTRARERYPLPKVERPRVVTDADGDDWRWAKDGGLQLRLRGVATWIEAEGGHITPVVRETIADLLAHPSEFVDDEG